MEQVTEEAVKEVMAFLGRSKSEKKLRAVARNGKATQFKPKLLKDIECTCGGGDVMTVEAHPTTCPRGRAIRYRIKKHLPLA